MELNHPNITVRKRGLASKNINQDSVVPSKRVKQIEKPMVSLGKLISIQNCSSGQVSKKDIVTTLNKITKIPARCKLEFSSVNKKNIKATDSSAQPKLKQIQSIKVKVK